MTRRPGPISGDSWSRRETRPGRCPTWRPLTPGRPRWPRPPTTSGAARLRLGDEVHGRPLIEAALARDPRLGYGEPHLRLADYYLDHGQPAEALTHLERFTEMHASSVEGQYKLARAYQATGQRGSGPRGPRRGGARLPRGSALQAPRGAGLAAPGRLAPVDPPEVKAHHRRLESLTLADRLPRVLAVRGVRPRQRRAVSMRRRGGVQ